MRDFVKPHHVIISLIATAAPAAVHCCRLIFRADGVVTCDMCVLSLLCVNFYTVSQKTRHQTLAHNFAKC